MSSYRIEIQHQHAQYCINRAEEPPRHRRQHQRQVHFSTVREGEGAIHAHVRSPAPSSLLPSHDFSRTQQRSRLNFREKLGFAIPVGHSKQYKRDRHAQCRHGDKPTGRSPTPVHGSGGQASSTVVFRGPRLVGACTLAQGGPLREGMLGDCRGCHSSAATSPASC